MHHTSYWTHVMVLAAFIFVPADDCYVIFDCPGQVELFTLHDCLQKTVQTLTNKLGYRYHTLSSKLIQLIHPPALPGPEHRPVAS